MDANTAPNTPSLNAPTVVDPTMARAKHRRIANTISAATLGGVVFVLTGLAFQSPLVAAVVAPEASVTTPQASQAERLVAQHGCWTGEAPTDAGYPGGVVIQRPSGKAAYSTRGATVDEALTAALGGAPVDYTVVAFCAGDAR